MEIPDDVTEIKSHVFRHCTNLTSVIIPNSVSSIGDVAFNDCTELVSVIMPNSVVEIGYYAFENTPWYDNQQDGLVYLNKVLYKYKGTMPENTSIEIADGTVSISPGAFYDCFGLSSVTIPSDITSIGYFAFYGCTNLANVNFNATNCTTMGSSSSPVFNGCTAFTTLNIGDNVTNIPEYAFCRCTGLTSVTIPNSVTSIGDGAFACCYGLTTVNFNATNCTTMGSSSYPVFNDCTAFTTLNIGDNVTNIPNQAFRGCSGLTSVTIPESVTIIGESAFSGCTDLTSVTIPNSVTSIGSSAFYNCSNLATLSGGENLSSIGTNAFWGCNKLINANVTRTQTTATINLTSPTQYNLGLYYSDSNKKQAENGVVKFTGLKPNYTNSNYDLALIINGIYCPIKDLSFTTQSFSASISGSATATSVSAIGTYTEGDVTILGEGINYGSSVTNYDGNNTITVYNLNPKTSYTMYYAVKTQEVGVYSTYKYFTTGDLTWSNGGFTATSTSSARLSVETTCDATAGTGFEWKCYDAPESLAPSKAPCPVVDGMLVGSLRNLNPDVYYKCRPYYTSSSGNTYYGDWVAFFTGDANVYFEPEVRTYEDIQVINNSATVKGYALEGTDVITAQGFEYWKPGNTITPSSTENRMTVSASGISMSATLANLEYNSTYKYRAFVTTAKGTTYGDEMEFSTGEDPAGIGYIEVNGEEFSVTLRENPATGTAWVKISGASGNEAQYVLTSISGAMVANGTIMLDGEWNAIELNSSAGMYLLTINDGSQVKTLRLIVK